MTYLGQPSKLESEMCAKRVGCVDSSTAETRPLSGVAVGSDGHALFLGNVTSGAFRENAKPASSLRHVTVANDCTNVQRLLWRKSHLTVNGREVAIANGRATLLVSEFGQSLK